MLTDEILREAAVDMEQVLLSAVPGEEESHAFSRRFERKMNRLIRRAEHPARYQVLRVAAAIVLVMGTLFGTVMAVSPEVRAGVLDWIKSTYSGSVHYSSDSDNSTTEELPPYDYRLANVPEGYKEDGVYDLTSIKQYCYERADGKLLWFSYKFPMGSSSVNIFGDYEYHSGYVNDRVAELYISPDGSEASHIVWNDPETKAILWVSAWTDAEELIAIAETVERINK